MEKLVERWIEITEKSQVLDPKSVLALLDKLRNKENWSRACDEFH